MKKNLQFIMIFFVFILIKTGCFAQQNSTFEFTAEGILITNNQDDMLSLYAGNSISGSASIINNSLVLMPPSNIVFSFTSRRNVRIEMIRVQSSVYGWAGARLTVYNDTFSRKKIKSEIQPKKNRYWKVHTNTTGNRFTLEFSSYRVPYLYDWERTAADKAEIILHNITIYWSTQ